MLVAPSAVNGHSGEPDYFGCHVKTGDGTYHCHQGEYAGQSFSSRQSFLELISSSAVAEPETDPESAIDTLPSAFFNRDEYLPGWADDDGDCLNTRHEVLIIESVVPVTMSPDGCSVVSGLWNDPFTGRTFTDPRNLAIDHLIPLSEAHDSGAASWPNSLKQAFANDLLSAEALTAVDASTHSAKGNRDPAAWLPPNAEFRCEYVRNWVEIKKKYGLTMDERERLAIESALSDGLYRATRPEIAGIRETVGDSNAAFSLGLSVNGSCGFRNTAAVGDFLELSLSITPEPGHIGDTIDVYMVAETGTGRFVVLPGGVMLPFRGSVAELQPLMSSVFLDESKALPIFAGSLAGVFDLHIYVAYQTSGGDFLFTPIPFILSVQ